MAAAGRCHRFALLFHTKQQTSVALLPWRRNWKKKKQAELLLLLLQQHIVETRLNGCTDNRVLLLTPLLQLCNCVYCRVLWFKLILSWFLKLGNIFLYTDAILKGYFGIFYANFNMQNSEKHAKFSAPYKLSLKTYFLNRVQCCTREHYDQFSIDDWKPTEKFSLLKSLSNLFFIHSFSADLLNLTRFLLCCTNICNVVLIQRTHNIQYPCSLQKGI